MSFIYKNTILSFEIKSFVYTFTLLGTSDISLKITARYGPDTLTTVITEGAFGTFRIFEDFINDHNSGILVAFPKYYISGDATIYVNLGGLHPPLNNMTIVLKPDVKKDIDSDTYSNIKPETEIDIVSFHRNALPHHDLD